MFVNLYEKTLHVDLSFFSPVWSEHVQSVNLHTTSAFKIYCRFVSH